MYLCSDMYGDTLHIDFYTSYLKRCKEK